MPTIAALLFTAATTCAVPPAEAKAQLALDYAAFDALSGACGWRVLNAAGCTEEAVRLLQDYATANAARLTAAERRELAFHAGQALAFADRDAEAIVHFERAQDATAPDEWRAYVAATLGFLRRDGAGVAAAPTAYAASAGDPLRLRIIDGFVACPNATYMDAAHCRM